MEIRTRNVNSAFNFLVKGISGGSIKTRKEETRNGPVLQIDEPVMITYEKPTERVLFNSERDCNPFFHVYEAMWMLAGRNDVAPLAYYTPTIKNYSDDGKTFNGAYGYRWKHAETVNERRTVGPDTYADFTRGGVSYIDQLDCIVDHLTRLPNSRRAVLQMWNVEDDLLKIGSDLECMQGKLSKDVCCNLSVMFSIRSSLTTHGADHRYDVNRGMDKEVRHLDMAVTNRSNDLIWGMLGANYCLAGETKFSSPEGDVSIKELTELFKTKKITKYPLYSFDPETKDFKISYCTKAWKTAHTKVIEIEFDDGTFLKVTPNHKLFKKKWNNNKLCTEVEAGSLKVGDRVWATQIWETEEGRKYIKKNLGKDTNWNNMVSVARAYYETVHGPIDNGHDIHHRDENKANDQISNLEKLTKSAHMKHHIRISHPMKLDVTRKKASDSRKAYFARMSPGEKQAYADARKGYVNSEETKAKKSASHKTLWENKTEAERKEFNTEIKRRMKGVPCKRFTGQKHSPETLDKMAAARKAYWEKKRALQSNHKIVSIRELPAEDVYDFTVPGNHNAMIDNGVMVHNCHFSFLQEYLACRLGVEIGRYTQFSNNLHVYTENNSGFHPEKWLADSRDYYTVTPIINVAPVPLVRDPVMFDREVKEFVEFNKDLSSANKDIEWVEPFFQLVAQPMCDAFHFHKNREYRDALDACSQIHANDWRLAATRWIQKRKTNRESKTQKEGK